MKRIPLLVLSAVASLAVLSGCNEDEETVVTPTETLLFNGPETAIGTGTGNTWVRTVNGKLDAMGITMNGAAITSLDSTMSSFRLALPAEAAPSGMTFVSVDWNPGGHPPMPTYQAPHFDFHFYYLTDTELAAIPGGPDTVQVAPQYIPPTFSYGPAPAISVPGMGVHYMDMTSHEFHGDDFTKTFIFGFSAGELAFLEPMVSKEYLLDYPTSTSFIPQPAAYQRPELFYPTKYTVKTDSAASEFVISLDAFAKP